MACSQQQQPHEPLELVERRQQVFSGDSPGEDLRERQLLGARRGPDQRKRVRHQLEAHVLELRRAEHGGPPASLEVVGHFVRLRGHRRYEFFHFFHGGQRVDEDDVGPEVGEGRGPPEGLFQGLCLPGV